MEIKILTTLYKLFKCQPISDLAMVITIEINNFYKNNNKLRTNKNDLIRIKIEQLYPSVKSELIAHIDKKKKQLFFIYYTTQHFPYLYLHIVILIKIVTT